MKMRSYILYVVYCLASVALLSGQSENSIANPQDHPLDIDVHEAVIRYQIKTWELCAASYCIEVNEKDATQELLKRLEPLPVKGNSGCEKENSVIFKLAIRDWVIDNQTKKRSVIFRISDIKWQSPSKAEVYGGYYCGSMCLAGGIYHIVWEGHRLTVTDFDIKIQS
jgi:hypothetical protein